MGLRELPTHPLQSPGVLLSVGVPRRVLVPRVLCRWVVGDVAIFLAPIPWRQADRCGPCGSPEKPNQRLRGSAAHPVKPHPYNKMESNLGPERRYHVAVQLSMRDYIST